MFGSFCIKPVREEPEIYSVLWTLRQVLVDGAAQVLHGGLTISALFVKVEKLKSEATTVVMNVAPKSTAKASVSP